MGVHHCSILPPTPVGGGADCASDVVFGPSRGNRVGDHVICAFDLLCLGRLDGAALLRHVCAVHCVSQPVLLVRSIVITIFPFPHLTFIPVRRTGVSGFTGGLVAMLVALVKENPVQPLGIPKLPCRYYPLLLTVLCVAMSVGAVLTKNEILIVGAGPYAVSGLYFGWVYLRFVAKNPDGSVGDESDAFSLTVLFPAFLKPSLAPLFDFCFNVSKLCGFFQHRQGHNATSGSSLAKAALASDPVTERRKYSSSTSS
ncbi:hypothetical protein, variant 5 [Aphanomyces astaci]|uniref:Uncharacterized protein n=1 Tax=Aphanomyces astaci TaxID=112090 RepID=W4H9H4_APHAT|nr:hypothetical protein, variant 5 [Aphanomyces astaci]ETV88675.1 hypothetical protein, variant 5 [Aphanomyces astaci]|eukprot:XP_009821075.1 hypothetical protein, variant 5 [Aphanomyces astaci]